MSHVIWSPAALADVQRLHEFLRSKDPIAARQAVKSIRQSLNWPSARRHACRVQRMAHRFWSKRLCRTVPLRRY
ncbi:type II toxin-antitoxin system RelE/ParE family toxin [Idiomarina aminovorans]|uniref:type II toxin-antitoxin system RelE/ParE family toxin n=1 Tax=Idiomarina aminovorans TaxID=2914829 RepID=UPI003FEE5246